MPMSAVCIVPLFFWFMPCLMSWNVMVVCGLIDEVVPSPVGMSIDRMVL